MQDLKECEWTRLTWHGTALLIWSYKYNYKYNSLKVYSIVH